MPVYGRVNPISIKDRLVFPGAPFWPKMKTSLWNPGCWAVYDVLFTLLPG